MSRKSGEVGMSEVIAKVTAIDNGLIEGELVGEIVRCKDCKNSGLDSSGTNGYWCSAHTEWHDADWFCADGKRKDSN